MYSYLYETRYGDYKDFYTIKPSAVLDIIQDISTKNSAERGYGIFELKDINRAWLLKGTNLYFSKKVKTLCPIEAFTAVKPPKGATSQRGCILKQEGEIVAKSISDWFLFDTQKMRPVRIPEEISSVYEVSDFNEDDFFTYRKPILIPDAKSGYKIRIANKEIDTNRHLNNQKGAELLMDALPEEFEFNFISLIYKKAAFLGDELEVCTQKTENGYYVHMQTIEKEICVAGRFENIVK